MCIRDSFNRVRGRENKFYLLTLSLRNDYSKNLSLSNFYEELKYLSWDSSRHFECIDDDSLDRLAQYYNGIVGEMCIRDRLMILSKDMA